jgi:hypothetical protein
MTPYQLYLQAIVAYGVALTEAQAANAAEAMALMVYNNNPTPANAAALANATLAASNANNAVTTAWQALLAARAGYQQAQGGNQ